MTNEKKKSLKEMLDDFTRQASNLELDALTAVSRKRKLTPKEADRIREIARRLSMLG